MIPTTMSHLAAKGFKEHYNGFVSKIELNEDGKTTEVTYLSGKVAKIPVTEF